MDVRRAHRPSGEAVGATPLDAAPTGAPRWAGPKPRLVVFRDVRTDLAPFVDGHLSDHLRCLRQFFDVTHVTGRADYDAVCDAVQPDLALFESGVYANRRRGYTRTDTHPDVPKVGLVSSDAYCVTRSLYLADMEEWGVTTTFTISMAMAAHTPDIADRLYVWPNFADRNVFHDYPVNGRVPLLLTGSRQAHYPWRVAVDDALRGAFDVTPQPHHGWFNKDAAAAMPMGEAYARQLASAMIVPSCGTMAHELVRKHFEIPAAGAVLVAQRTGPLEAAGFRDGVNCVFADPSDVVDKVRWLLADDAARESIARAGQALVHARHDITTRDQLRQWYELQRVATAADTIVQDDPFGPMRLEPNYPVGRAVTYVAPPSTDLLMLEEARELTRSGQYARAATRYQALLDMHFVPEASRELAAVLLTQGRLDEAHEVVHGLLRDSLRDWGAVAPDPVEWALYLRVLLCAGQVSRAARRARAYPAVTHPELDRMRAVVGAVAGARLPAVVPGSAPVPAPQALAGRRRSVHVVAHQPWAEWVDALRRDLTANGHGAMAETLAAVAEPVASGRPRSTRRHTRLPREFRAPFWPRVIPAVRRRLPWRRGAAVPAGGVSASSGGT